MFKTQLTPLTDDHPQPAARALYSLATHLIDLFCEECHQSLRYKDKLAFALSSELGEMIRRYRFDEAYQNNKKLRFSFPQYKGDKGIFISLSKKGYESEEGYAACARAISLTYDRQVTINMVLAYFQILDWEDVEGDRRKTTQIWVRPLREWSPTIWKDLSPKIFFHIYSLFHSSGTYNLYQAGERKGKEHSCAVIKHIAPDGEKVLFPAPSYIEKEVEDFNSLWGEGLKEELTYTRIFNSSLDRGGRLYGPISSMKKSDRKLYFEALGLSEVDITAQFINTLGLIANGSIYEKRPYDMIAEEIVNSKFLKKWGVSKESALQMWGPELARALKPIILQMFNTDKAIKDTKISINEQLAKKGLRISKKDIFEANAYARPLHDIKSDYYTTRGDFISHRRDGRWATFSSSSRPPFSIKAEELILAIRKIFPELSMFLFRENWSFVQKIESNLMLKMASLLKEKDCLPILVHDALYVPQEYQEIFEKEIYKIFESEVQRFVEGINEDMSSLQKVAERTLDDVIDHIDVENLRLKKDGDIYKKDMELITLKITNQWVINIKSLAQGEKESVFYGQKSVQDWLEKEISNQLNHQIMESDEVAA
ncbi:MAG: hypothetical protein MI717_09645 [Spirochaetales bacterium]|nr:hypothetical protein [Spirochaetales bacterium]